MEETIYKKMYYHLFNGVLDALKAETKTECDEFLKKAQIETEELYISVEE